MKNILCFGDSNTWGYNPNTKERYPWGIRWTSKLQDRLSKNDIHIIEQGLCGRTTAFEDISRPDRKGVNTLKDIFKNTQNIDSVILMLGTNDCKTYFGNSEDDIARGVDACLDQVLKYVSPENVLLVNYAGVGGRYEPIGELENDLWEKIISVNLTGTMYAMRKAVNVFLQQESAGNIVNIASMAGLKGCRASSAYTASKHGVIGLTEHTAYMYLHKGIRVNAVCPGAIKTDMSANHEKESAFGFERVKAGMDPIVPYGTPKNIADAVLFVTSDEASFITGASLVVDGGISCN